MLTTAEPIITPSEKLDIFFAWNLFFIPNPTKIGKLEYLFIDFIDFSNIFKSAEFFPVTPVIDT